jgi:alditol oxidase
VKEHKMSERRQNWAGNLLYSAVRWHEPRTLNELQAIVARSEKLRVVGSRHSFNDIADSPHDIVSLEKLPQHVEIDAKNRTATVNAGIKYGDLALELHRAGFALHNMASLPHISVAGACATATHGSGVGNGNLATVVRGMEFIAAGGDAVSVSRDEQGDQFPGMVVNLGGLGVVTSMTLDIMPSFAIRQDVYEHLPFAALEQHFDDVMARAYSVSLFTKWRDNTVDQVWLKSVIGTTPAAEPPANLFGATPATVRRHPLPDITGENCTEQGGVPGPWHERLPHFRMEFTPSIGEELQTEYLIPRRYAVDALRAVNSLGDLIAPALQISEVRTIAADDLWMSPFYHEDCIGIHFTWIRDWSAVSAVLPVLEEHLAPFEARPHWGKLFTTEPSVVRSLFPKLPDFQRLLHDYDPQGKFRNPFLDRYVFG